MAARDTEFYNYLKEALKTKLRYPQADSFKLGKYNFDYEYIFQQARRVFPQKYSIAHSYLHQTPISYLNKEELNQLNLEYAADLVKGFGGLDEKQATAREVDQELTTYLEEDTAPEEPNSFYQELDQHQLPPSDEQNQQPQEEQQESSGGQGGQRQSPPRYVIQRPLTNKERFGTKEAYAKYKEENKESRDERARKLWEDRRKSGMSKEQYGQYKEENKDERSERAKKLWDRRKASLLKPKPATGGWNPLGDWLGKKLAQSRFVQPALKALEGLAERLGLNPVLNGLKALNNLLEWPERMLGRLAGQLGRGALNLAGNALRAGFSALAEGAAGLMEGLAGVGATVGEGLATVGAFLGGISLLAWIWIIVIAAIFIFYIWSVFDANSECGKPGTPNILKSVLNGKDDEQGNKVFQQGEQINYQIQILYQLKCGGYVDVAVKDTIPTGTTYVEGSIKADTQVDWQGLAGTTSEQGRDDNILFWNIKSLPNRYPITLNFTVTADQSNAWIANEAQATFKAYGRFGQSVGGFSDITGLLPNPLTPSVANWTSIKSQIIAAYNKHPELLDIYKQASAQSGVPWQILAGLHFVETGSGPGPDSSLVSGRKLGQIEPNIDPKKCAGGVTGPGTPTPVGGGCGFSNQLDSAIYAAIHLSEKIGKVPSTFPEVVEALSMYNGGGNANCGEGLPYSPCPPQFKGEDDPYAMADFDEAHSSDKMYKIFCGERTKCNPKEIFGRPGAMGVVRALIEEGL